MIKSINTEQKGLGTFAGVFTPSVLTILGIILFLGFTQGVSMSGDLKDPAKSLPLGTFLAVGVSIAVYFGAAVVFSGALTNEDLILDYSAMKRISRYPVLIDMGVIAATLSSAMASFLGAPRIMQSLAADRVFPFLFFFAKGSGETANPRRAPGRGAGPDDGCTGQSEYDRTGGGSCQDTCRCAKKASRFISTSHAVSVMRVGLSVSSIRRRYQTTLSCIRKERMW